MASGDTKTEALLNILGHGGSVDGITGSGNTKTQDYLVDAIGRIQGIEDEVEELKNNPDVVDIVNTYADLQAYDTQHLTNDDIIRVLNDETHSGNSTYYKFTKNPDTWTFVGEISGGGGGATGEPKVLTTSDYNANSANWDDTDPANFDCVALWKLPAGMYQKNDSTVTAKVTRFSGLSIDQLAIVGKMNNNYRETPIIVIDAKNQSHGGATLGLFYYVPQNGLNYGGVNLRYDLKNDLTTTTDGFALDATQGKVLKGLIDNVAPYNITSIATNAYNDQGNPYSITVAQYNEVLSAVQAYRPILFTKIEGSVDPTTTYSIMAKVEFVSTGSAPSINIYDNEGGFFALNYGDGEPDIGYYI